MSEFRNETTEITIFQRTEIIQGPLLAKPPTTTTGKSGVSYNIGAPDQGLSTILFDFGTQEKGHFGTLVSVLGPSPVVKTK